MFTLFCNDTWIKNHDIEKTVETLIDWPHTNKPISPMNFVCYNGTAGERFCGRSK